MDRSDALRVMTLRDLGGSAKEIAKILPASEAEIREVLKDPPRKPSWARRRREKTRQKRQR